MKTYDTKKCMHCKKDHTGLELKKMKNALFDTGIIYTHYVICPETGYMIMITKEDANSRVEKQNNEERNSGSKETDSKSE